MPWPGKRHRRAHVGTTFRGRPMRIVSVVAVPYRVCLARARPMAPGVDASRWLGLETRWMGSLCRCWLRKTPWRRRDISHPPRQARCAIDVFKSGGLLMRGLPRRAWVITSEAAAMANGHRCIRSRVFADSLPAWNGAESAGVAFERTKRLAPRCAPAETVQTNPRGSAVENLPWSVCGGRFECRHPMDGVPGSGRCMNSARCCRSKSRALLSQAVQ